LSTPVQNLVDDARAHGDQHHVRARTAPFITLVDRQARQGAVVEAFAVVATGQRLTAYQAHLAAAARHGRTGRGCRG
jgi:hypothetical protein